MSVYKANRKESLAAYLEATREMRKITIQIVKKFPNSYRYSITNNLLTLAADAYTNVLMADAIHITKQTNIHDYELRHRYLMIALSKMNALFGEVTFCYYLTSNDNTIFKNTAAYNKAFQKWNGAIEKANNKIQKIIDSDKLFWEKTHKI